MTSEFYHTAPAALAELRRRQDAGVQATVKAWWHSKGHAMPKLPDLSNAAVLARQVATCRFEDILYRQVASEAGFVPTWWPYLADVFTSMSPYKLSLLHPVCVRKTTNGRHLQTKKLAHPHQWEKKPLGEIKSITGGSMIEWHRTHREQVLGPTVTVDMPALPYELFLSFFVAHAVLFEDYHGGESGNKLDSFTSTRFEPAWRLVRDELGLAPIVVPLPWWSDLCLYPATADWQCLGVLPEQS